MNVKYVTVMVLIGLIKYVIVRDLNLMFVVCAVVKVYHLDG